jgi:hypothetical protein
VVFNFVKKLIEQVLLDFWWICHILGRNVLSLNEVYLIPYAILLGILLLFMSLSYVHSLPLDELFPRWGDHRGAWALYSAGKLQREVQHGEDKGLISDGGYECCLAGCRNTA